MEVVVASEDAGLIRALANWKPAQPAESGEAAMEIRESAQTPGAAGSWSEVVAALDDPAIPMGVAAGLLFTWIWSGVEGAGSLEIKVRIAIRSGGKEVSVELWKADPITLRTLIGTALGHLHTSLRAGSPG